MKIYNVLTRTKEEFVPINEGKVLMYACGITASGEAHIGHAYQALIFDVIRSYLQFSGYEVKYVRNYTDVDDKILVNAKKAKMPPLEFANKIIDLIDADFAKLDIVPPTIESRATECIQDIIVFIEKLIKDGYAYVSEEGDVYFRVSSFERYGMFSNRLHLDKLLGGVRKQIEKDKDNERDFALWKSAGSDTLYWDSPWGKGRPGWHIECSAMSQKYLADTIDIHGGGRDLIFPHHENEIAQSEAKTGKQFARYWIHNGLIKVNGQKMSKSLNNSIFLKDLLQQFNSDVIKFTILQNSYRSDLNIMDDTFTQNESKIYELYKLFDRIDCLCAQQGEAIEANMDNALAKRIHSEFIAAMDNDFNTALVTANLFTYISELGKMCNQKSANTEDILGVRQMLKKVFGVLRLLSQEPKDVVGSIRQKYLDKAGYTQQAIQDKLKLWSQYKNEKDFVNADAIRNELLQSGFVITPQGDWEINFKSAR